MSPEKIEIKIPLQAQLLLKLRVVNVIIDKHSSAMVFEAEFVIECIAHFMAWKQAP